MGPFRFPNRDAAAARVLNNSRLIKMLGHDVSIISFGGERKEDSKDWEDYEGIQYIISKDIDTHSWTERLTRYIYPYTHCRYILKQELQKYDIIVSYNTPFLFNRWLIRLCRRYDKKLVFDITEWYSAQEMPGGRFTPIYWMSEINMRFLLAWPSNRILISKFLFNYYKENGNNIILPPLVDLSENKWNTSEFNYPKSITNFSGIRLLYAGTPTNKDLIGSLISAVLSNTALLDQIQIIIAGVKEMNAPLFFKDINQFYQQKDHFVFLGRLDQEIIPAYYNLSDFSVIIREPTRKNMAGFPTKMAESMAAGCPIFVNYFSDIPDYVKDGESAIVIQDTSDASIVRGLQRIINMSAEERCRMRVYAQEVGERYFDYRNYLERMASFLSNI